MNPPALQLHALHKQVGAAHILRGVSLDLARGERMALIGPNGAGKSTLFNLVSGRAAPSSGRILLHGQPIQGLPPYAIHRRGLARSFQTSHLFPQLSVWDNLRCSALWRHGQGYSFWRRMAGQQAVAAQAAQILAQVQLEAQRDTLAGQLGYAEQRALELGITLASGASVLLLDEPTAGMGAAEAQRFVQLIRTVTVDKTLLIVEHDMQVVYALASKIAVLVAGTLVACGSPDAVRADPQVQAAYLGADLGADLDASQGHGAGGVG